MSLTNVKDLDILICTYLNNKDLISFSQTNKHYYNIYNETSLWIHKILKFKNEYLCKKLDKSYYIELYKAVKNENFVKVIFDAINAKRCDIVSLVFREKQLNPNYSFMFRYEVKLDKIYYATEVDNNAPYTFCPINLAINVQYYPMWDFFNRNYKLDLDSYVYIVSIARYNYEIFKDVLKYEIPIEHYVLLFSIRSYNLETTKIILDIIDEKEIYNMLNIMNIDFKKEYMKWINEYNNSFEQVLRKVDLDYLKNIAERNFSKLLSFYISSMDTYSK